MTELKRSSSMLAFPGPRPLGWAKRGGLLALFIGMLAWWQAPGSTGGERESRDRLLASELERKLDVAVDLQTAPHWVEDHQGSFESLWRDAWAVVRATPAHGRFHDIYLAAVRLGPEGQLLRVDAAYNVTQTELADEAGLVGFGPRFAWTVPGRDRIYRVEYADLLGDELAESNSWPALARWQQGLTNLQQTGLLGGIARRSFRLDPAAHHTALALDGERLHIDADGRVTEIPVDGRSSIAGARHIQEEPRVVARPGDLTTWAVDRARDLPWFGSERMQLVKALAYKAWDYAQRWLPQDESKEWVPAQTLAEPAAATEDAPAAAGTPDTTRWPPPSLAGVSTGPAGESLWRAPTGDPFVLQTPDRPLHIVTNFVRPDPERPDARVAIVIWDPRQLELRFMAGTNEPRSDTGETASGLIPREPEVISRLVGAFNGGFQTAHGHWGTMVDGKVLAPPRFYGATVAHLKDGAVGFGTWPPSSDIPDEIDSFRQNLTPLIGGGRLNPYGRSWWGGVPLGWEDDTRTVRAGLCLTKADLVAYFYGSRVDHMDLAHAMMMVGCDYAIHLDMNQGHTGFEFYTVGPNAELPPVAFPLERTWQAEGQVPELPGYRFRGRRLFPTMQLMHFPRYINRSSRDFFYLLLRRSLPGPALKSAFADDAGLEGRWQISTQEQRAFAPAVATTWLRPSAARPETKVRVVKLDLKWLSSSLVAPAGSPSDALVSFSLPALQVGESALELNARRARLNRTADSASGQGADAPDAAAPSSPGLVVARDEAAPPVAAWGLVGDDILVYAEVVTGREPSQDRELLAGVLRQADCTRAVFSSHPAFVALAGGEDLAGHPIDRAAFTAPERRILAFSRAAWQPQRRLFTDTPVVGSAVWFAYQSSSDDER